MGREGVFVDIHRYDLAKLLIIYINKLGLNWAKLRSNWDLVSLLLLLHRIDIQKILLASLPPTTI